MGGLGMGLFGVGGGFRLLGMVRPGIEGVFLGRTRIGLLRGIC